MNGTILVAGATGRVGSAAVRHLPHAGFEVRALARSVDKGRPLHALDAEVVIGDVTKQAHWPLPSPNVRVCIRRSRRGMEAPQKSSTGAT